jgi:hypothetical protein
MVTRQDEIKLVVVLSGTAYERKGFRSLEGYQEYYQTIVVSYSITEIIVFSLHRNTPHRVILVDCHLVMDSQCPVKVEGF